MAYPYVDKKILVIKAYYLPDCKSRGKLQEKQVQLLGTGSMF